MVIMMVMMTTITTRHNNNNKIIQKHHYTINTKRQQKKKPTPKHLNHTSHKHSHSSLSNVKGQVPSVSPYAPSLKYQASLRINCKNAAGGTCVVNSLAGLVFSNTTARQASSSRMVPSLPTAWLASTFVAAWMLARMILVSVEAKASTCAMFYWFHLLKKTTGVEERSAMAEEAAPCTF